MRSLRIAVLLATAVALSTATNPLDLVDDLIASPSSAEAASLPPPVKLDKNLRRALLKALVDLEAESAEQQQQQQQQQESSTNPATSNNQEDNSKDIDENRYDFLEISKQKSTSFSFDGFPSEDETPSEDKLQNTTFVESSDKYVTGDEATNNRPSNEQQPPKDYSNAVQVHHVVSSEKSIYETNQPGELLESVESRSITSSTSSSSAEASPTATTTTNVNNDSPLIQQSVTFAPIVETSRETLTASASGNIASAAANSLIAPRPTAATNPINDTSTTFGSKIAQVSGKSNSNANKEEAEDVKIFQAPLVAAFTVQQDERGVPKNIVPLYKNTDNVQPLSLQEQLEFKQRLLEKQLAQLQAQQAQQTQFLLRQRQAYEEQVRQKQQQEYYLQEQRRLKLLQEQEQQRLRLQQQQQQQRPTFPQPANLLQQQLPLPQQQTLFKANNVPTQQQSIFKPNNILQQQSIFKTNNIVQQQQSIFKPNNVPQQQQQQQQQPPPQQQQANFKPNNAINNVQQSSGFNSQQTTFKANNVQLQPSLSLQVPNNVPAIPFQQQNFQAFPVDFQQPPAPTPVTRFNRQEAFNAVGNFGFNHFQNDDKSNRQSQFAQQQQQQRVQQNNNFAFNSGFRQQQQRPFTPTVTPARQIQELLYQSGIAGDLQGSGTRNQEDINIVSKVLALNVGAFPEQRTKGFQQFSGLK